MKFTKLVNQTIYLLSTVYPPYLSLILLFQILQYKTCYTPFCSAITTRSLALIWRLPS